jgi:hypothetical protein
MSGGKHSETAGYIPGVHRALLLTALFAGPLWAQASPYLPLDHPLTPLVEHLMARGALLDPTPMIRPLRRIDVVRAIDSSNLDLSTPTGRLASEIRRALLDRADGSWVRVAPRAGATGFTRARRDLLHPAGAGGVRPYFEAAFQGVFGNLVLASRPIADNRLKLDPDWAGASVQRTKNQAYRFTDAYLAAQFERVRLVFGQMDRNWGPTGSLGLSLADYGYPRTDFGLEVVLRMIQIQIVGTELTAVRSIDGTDHKRYFMAHRLNARVTKRLSLALWETGILAGRDRSFEPGFRNPLLLFSFPLQLGLPDDRNTIIGGDLAWRTPGGVLLEGQAMIDDRWRTAADSVTGEGKHPGRWAVSVAGSGPLGTSLGWKASFAAVSALAYRTIDSAQSFIDRGVGIGPHFTDLLRAELRLGVPIGLGWLVTPGLTWLRQGEGRIDAPFPSGEALSSTPELGIGVSATTWRAGVAVAGSFRGIQVQGEAGWQQTRNADHIVGRSRTRFEGRVGATIGTSWSGALK